MESSILVTENLKAYYGDHLVLKGVNLEVPRLKITAIMGPSGCGKTTLLRCFNRLHELSPEGRIEGRIWLGDTDILSLDPIMVRRRIGMVFQRPNPFPTMSIYDNVIAGYKLNGMKLSRIEADEIVEQALRSAALWDEVKDILHRKGTFLSGGQQQRLCIARALAMKPEVLLLDEPTSALDPKATARIEELLVSLKERVTIMIVTHNIGQAGRIADYTAFLYLGELVEFGPTERLFTAPRDRRTEEYLSGKFG
ncbi:phosphate ABC transporter ATP-binding protein PstB [Thermodesulforhabdus norvegica]|uniref:Phosphate transport system ATP-binding protein n=1 Tax=Thermodesulforhabdus norvegica TaxID=39841 RepID=A0A1I4VWC1_9BACT|nr:phosphate ABC transporter ATP-binding protein PstB [Thermodesulforhabdus norvegica]SFN05502.1 phosphate transport system ATP-binding protein [Thermodesulforhabdus norvegica]